MKVFISYRRDDSIIHARLIHNELASRFGEADVFMDIDDIDYGDDFAQKINQRLDAADVVVAVIGPQWADMLVRRAHGDDYVRHELARSLARGKRIVPVLIGDASPPDASLPPDLAGPARIASTTPSMSRTTGSSSLVLPGGLYGLYRWSVVANDGRGKSGPSSGDAHFYCPG